MRPGAVGPAVRVHRSRSTGRRPRRWPSRAGPATSRSAAAAELVTASGTSPFGTPSFSVERSGDSANVEFCAGRLERRGRRAWRHLVEDRRHALAGDRLGRDARDRRDEHGRRPVERARSPADAQDRREQRDAQARPGSVDRHCDRRGDQGGRVRASRCSCRATPRCASTPTTGCRRPTSTSSFTGMGAGVWQTPGLRHREQDHQHQHRVRDQLDLGPYLLGGCSEQQRSPFGMDGTGRDRARRAGHLAVLGTFCGWMVAPIAAIIRVASRVIWPLVVIGIGVLLDPARSWRRLGAERAQALPRRARTA